MCDMDGFARSPGRQQAEWGHGDMGEVWPKDKTYVSSVLQRHRYATRPSNDPMPLLFNEYSLRVAARRQSGRQAGLQCV